MSMGTNRRQATWRVWAFADAAALCGFATAESRATAAALSVVSRLAVAIFGRAASLRLLVTTATFLVTTATLWLAPDIGLHSVHAQPPPMEVVHSKCETMQDIIDALVADYADLDRVKRGDKEISSEILQRLSAGAPDQIEKLLKCFEHYEWSDFDENNMWGRIPVAMLNIPYTATRKEFGQVRIVAWILVRKKDRRITQVRGEYRADY